MNLAEIHQCFRETYCLYLQERKGGGDLLQNATSLPRTQHRSVTTLRPHYLVTCINYTRYFTWCEVEDVRQNCRRTSLRKKF